MIRLLLEVVGFVLIAFAFAVVLVLKAFHFPFLDWWRGRV